MGFAADPSIEITRQAHALGPWRIAEKKSGDAAAVWQSKAAAIQLSRVHKLLCSFFLIAFSNS